MVIDCSRPGVAMEAGVLTLVDSLCFSVFWFLKVNTCCKGSLDYWRGGAHDVVRCCGGKICSFSAIIL